MKKIILIIVITLGILADNNIYIGLQLATPSDGISIKIDKDEKIAFQAIFDLLGSKNSVALRGIYRFKRDFFYNLYGYGEVGVWNWDRRYYYEDKVETFGYGGGVGVEYDLRDLDSQFIPLFLDFEFQLHFFNDSKYYYDDNSELGVGLGIHYKF